MGTGPLGDDVGDDASVVFGVDVERLARRNRHVDAVHPGVAREAHVEQVRQRLTADGLGEVEQRAAARWAGQLRAGPHCPRPRSSSHSAMSCVGGQGLARSRTCTSFMPSHQYCAPISAVTGRALAHLAHELAGRRLPCGRRRRRGRRRARTSHSVQSVGFDQSSASKLRSCVGELPVLGRGDRHGFVVTRCAGWRSRRGSWPSVMVIGPSLPSSSFVAVDRRR